MGLTCFCFQWFVLDPDPYNLIRICIPDPVQFFIRIRIQGNYTDPADSNPQHWIRVRIYLKNYFFWKCLYWVQLVSIKSKNKQFFNEYNIVNVGWCAAGLPAGEPVAAAHALPPGPQAVCLQRVRGPVHNEEQLQAACRGARRPKVPVVPALPARNSSIFRNLIFF